MNFLQDVAVVIACLHLYSHFDLRRELIVPLLLQDKINVLETLVKGDEEEQRKLVQFFDEISHKEFSLNTLIPTDTRVSVLSVICFVVEKSSAIYLQVDAYTCNCV